jgi:hypothetical protein
MTALLALVVAVVIAVMTDLLTGWVRAGLRRASAGVRRLVSRGDPALDDHTTIHAGWIRVDSGSWPRVHVHLRCAPSARWQQVPRMDRDGVYRFVHRVAPGVFPHEADYSVPDELVRFASATDLDATQRDQAFACASPPGVLEVSMSIEHRETDSGPVIAAADVAAMIGGFRSEVASGAFERIFGLSPSRVDWFLNVSPSVSREGFQQEAWVDVDFPGRRPGGRASGMRPPADLRGYGRAASQSLPITASVDSVARPLLTDFLERNGFRDVQGAIDDLVDGVRTAESQNTRSFDTRS